MGLALSHVLEPRNRFDDIFKPPRFRSPWEHEVALEKVDEFKRRARSETTKFLKACSLEAQGIGKPQYIMIPKDQFTYRRVAWIDPFDAIKYLSAALLVYPELEAARVNKAELVVHSHRKSDSDDLIFDSHYGYDSFRHNSGELSSKYSGKWKVITDIANFFDRIGNHPLENHLLDSGCDEPTTKLIASILMHWSGGRRSFGIPVGSDASRILSEAALLEVDRKLTHHGLRFIRYVDDFRFFAETRAEAHDAVRFLSEVLAEEGLSLNHKKTSISQILDEEEVFEDGLNPAEETHTPIDTDRRIVVTKRTAVSGKSNISQFYRQPGKDTIKALNSLDIIKHLESMPQRRNAEQEAAIRIAVKYFLYVDQNVDILINLLSLKITSILYIVDALIKDADKLDVDKKIETRNAILDEMDYEKCGYPFLLPLLRLTSAEGYEDQRIAENLPHVHRITDNPIFFREAVFIAFNQFRRGTLRDLAINLYPQAPVSLKRALYYAVENSSKLKDGERSALLKDMRLGTEDPFIRGF